MNSHLITCAKATIGISVPILLTTAVLKAVTVWDTGRGLPSEDPVFTFLSTRYLFGLVAALELGTVFLLMSSQPVRVKAAALLALTTSFLLYRASMLMLFSEVSCGCAGPLAMLPPVISKAVEFSLFMYVALAWIALAAYFLPSQHLAARGNEA